MCVLLVVWAPQLDSVEVVDVVLVAPRHEVPEARQRFHLLQNAIRLGAARNLRVRTQAVSVVRTNGGRSWGGRGETRLPAVLFNSLWVSRSGETRFDPLYYDPLVLSRINHVMRHKC